MKPPLHDIELIERYFDDTLSSEDTRTFKDKLKMDFDFHRLFHQEKILIHTIRYQAARRDLDFLKGIESSIQNKATERPWIHRSYFAVAACVTLIALALWTPWDTKKSEGLFESYFEPHPNIFEPTLRGEADNTLRRQAFQAYEEKDYERASSLFNELLKKEQDPGMLMLLGNSNLVLGKITEAKENFSDLIVHSNDLEVPAKWYLALCYLRTENKSGATPLLKDVQVSQTPYASKARELLREIE